MKEIGEKLKNTREEMGISLEEAAEDLKTKVEQLNDVESGNMEAFQDIFYVKYFIRDYAKYLGLDYEDMVDEFNEYLFDYTSKISLAEIKEARKDLNGKKEALEQKISSPYTIEHKEKRILSPFVVYSLIAILMLLIGYIVYTLAVEDNYLPLDNTMVADLERGYYEFT